MVSSGKPPQGLRERCPVGQPAVRESGERKAEQLSMGQLGEQHREGGRKGLFRGSIWLLQLGGAGGQEDTLKHLLPTSLIFLIFFFFFFSSAVSA